MKYNYTNPDLSGCGVTAGCELFESVFFHDINGRKVLLLHKNQTMKATPLITIKKSETMKKLGEIVMKK